jgi:hypothetical protein
MQSVFSPRKGFDLKNDMINGFFASVSLDYGKLVNVSDSTNYLGLVDADSVDNMGYFLMEQVTDSGPTLAEFALGDIQYEKCAGANTAVAVLVPHQGNVVRTKWVSVLDYSCIAGKLCLVSDGLFYTTSTSGLAKGKIKEVITDSISTTLYDVVIV